MNNLNHLKITIFVTNLNCMVIKLQNIFSNKRNQLFFYSIGILLWTVLMWFDDLSERTFYSNFELSHIFNWLIPDAILLFQMIYSNKVTWAIILVCVSICTLFTTIGIFQDPIIGIPITLFFVVMSFSVYLMRPDSIKKQPVL